MAKEIEKRIQFLRVEARHLLLKDVHAMFVHMVLRIAMVGIVEEIRLGAVADLVSALIAHEDRHIDRIAVLALLIIHSNHRAPPVFLSSSGSNAPEVSPLLVPNHSGTAPPLWRP